MKKIEFTKSQVKEIVKLYLDGYSYRQIADVPEFEASYATIMRTIKAAGGTPRKHGQKVMPKQRKEKG